MGSGGGGVEKEEKGRLICKNHLSFVSAAAGGCKFPFGSSFSFRFPLIVITPSCSLFAPGSRSLHFVINFSLLICNILATLYTLNFSNNPLRKSQCIRLSHFLMNVFKLGKPAEYFYRLVWQLLLSNLWHLFNFKNVWIVYCKARNKLVVFNVNPVYTLGFNFRTCSERTIPGDPYWKKLGGKASSRKKAKLNKGTSYSSAWYKLLLKPRKFNISQFNVE